MIYEIISTGSNGTAVLTNPATGDYTYTPNSNFNGIDVFTFQAHDPALDSNIASITISINPVNDTPTATNGSFSINEDTVYTGSLSGTDIDGNPLTYSIVTHPTKGSVSITNTATGAFTFTPTANANGSDSFTFKVNDGTVDSNTATVTVTINPVNDAPTGSVTVSGTVTQGSLLTATNTLADADGLGSISYKWQVSVDGSSSWSDIVGATANTFTLTQNEVGKYIRSVASYTDLQGTAESVTSSATSAVTNLNDSPTGSVTITGPATQGETLTATNTLADLDGMGTVGYQWKANGISISGATNSTLILTESQVGKTITVVASYIDG
ncbi:MAG: tandem-95 repeat protein, partial [Magnetococcales bacterium]|nr:tandem-95 repeat protein [Magnetococcales bacterium]